ncbi:hypothetical protein MMC26_007119 [Xylographa opegraphella]|nr:hypothetical protein [Xylographa opegraphella]
MSTKPQTPSRLKDSSSPDPTSEKWTPKNQNLSSMIPREPPTSPSRNDSAAGGLESQMDVRTLVGTMPTNSSTHTRNGSGSSRVPANGNSPAPTTFHNDALSRLPQAQVREMREAFQMLDRDSDGQVNRDDVVEMLGSLGLDTSGSSLAPFFPPSQPSTLALPAYLSTLSNLLAPLSGPSELLAAFAAFDDDDSGQIDISELRDALLHTSPDIGEKAMNDREVDAVVDGWIGRRAFGKGLTAGGIKGKGDVFRYREWVSSLGSAGDQAQDGQRV